MVQELGYDSCAMFPTRQGTPYNMNLSPYYTTQQPTQYNQTDFAFQDVNFQQPAAASAGPWANYMSGGAARPGTTGLEEWPQFHTMQTHSQTNSQNPTPMGYSTYHHRQGGIPPMSMANDYNQTNQQSMGNSLSPLTSSPSPVSIIGAQGAGANRQTRAPYDWMKKQTYQSAPSSDDFKTNEHMHQVGEIGSKRKTRTKDKYRVVYSDHQRLELEKEFHYSRYITIRRKAELAQALNLSERQVKIWFQNRRAKERKSNKKKEESQIPNIKNEIIIQPQSQLPTQSQLSVHVPPQGPH